MRQLFLRHLVCLLLVVVASTNGIGQRRTANVLHSDLPLPIHIGIDAGVTLTPFLNATPTFFPTDYPYSNDDVIAMNFPDGFSLLPGLHLGIAADFSVSEDWGIHLKGHYNSKRGKWNSTESVTCELESGNKQIPLTNQLKLLLHFGSFDLFARYTIHSLDELYIGGGLGADFLVENHYDIEQALSTSETECSFLDLGTGLSTGVQSYRMGRSFDDLFNSFLLEAKLLVGYPIPVATRLTLNPELMLGYPITQLYTDASRAEYKRDGYPATPQPLTVSILVGVRYEF